MSKENGGLGRRKYSRWFPVGVNPVRKGWYEWEHSSAMRYWNGDRWLDSVSSPMPFFYPWRGLAERSKP